MCRSPLENVILKAKQLEMGPPCKIISLAMDRPTMFDLRNTILLLKETGALLRTCDGVYLDEDGDMTFIGRIMATLPVNVNVAKLVVLGYCFSVLSECIIIGEANSRSFSRYLKFMLAILLVCSIRKVCFLFSMRRQFVSLTWMIIDFQLFHSNRFWKNIMSHSCIFLIKFVPLVLINDTFRIWLVHFILTKRKSVSVSMYHISEKFLNAQTVCCYDAFLGRWNGLRERWNNFHLSRWNNGFRPFRERNTFHSVQVNHFVLVILVSFAWDY